jgi:hypothetical protein
VAAVGVVEQGGDSPLPAAEIRAGLPISQLAKSRSKVISSVVGSP